MNRIWTLGPQLRDSQSPTWELLDQPREGASRIFYQDSWLGIGQIAFESPKPRGRGSIPPVVKPASAYPDDRGAGQYFYTSAPLTGVLSVTACHYKLDREPAIVGLLFHYEDGRQRSVGQIRLDSLGSSVRIDPRGRMGFQLSSNSWKVIGFQPMHTENEGWISMPWRGSLGWWFSHMACQLAHEVL